MTKTFEEILEALPPEEQEAIARAAEEFARTCHCRHCIQSRNIDEIVERRDPDELIGLIRELQEQLAAVETELEWLTRETQP